jgi:hypothetical protein
MRNGSAKPIYLIGEETLGASAFLVLSAGSLWTYRHRQLFTRSFWMMELQRLFIEPDLRYYLPGASTYLVDIMPGDIRSLSGTELPADVRGIFSVIHGASSVWCVQLLRLEITERSSISTGFAFMST